MVPLTGDAVTSGEQTMLSVIVIKPFLNHKGHQNLIHGSKVVAILLKGWILPVGGASAVEGLRSTGLPRLVTMWLDSVLLTCLFTYFTIGLM